MKYVVSIVLSLILLSCSAPEKDLKPYSKLSKEKFIQVYIELKTIEIHLQNKTTSHPLYRKWMEEAGDSIFKKYDTSSEDFYGAYDYYMQEPQELHALFEAALDTINLRKNKLNK